MEGVRDSDAPGPGSHSRSLHLGHTGQGASMAHAPVCAGLTSGHGGAGATLPAPPRPGEAGARAARETCGAGPPGGACREAPGSPAPPDATATTGCGGGEAVTCSAPAAASTRDLRKLRRRHGNRAGPPGTAPQAARSTHACPAGRGGSSGARMRAGPRAALPGVAG